MSTTRASKIRMNGNRPEIADVVHNRSRHRWAIVLAAGDGTRLHALTTLRRGVAVPKQFCSLNGGPSLLRQAVARASEVVPNDHVLVVVAESHRRWWREELSDLPSANVIVQPSNRGTAAGILLPLLALLHRDPEARLLVVPSDHFVADEKVLARAAYRALERVRARDRIVLLGISPDTAESGFGWIVPGRRRQQGLTAVSEFIEKPGRHVATRLMRQGAVWNSFLFAAGADHLLRCYQHQLPDLTIALESAVGARVGSSSSRVRKAYASLPGLDFSRDLLEHTTSNLEVLTVPGCGWSDLGTPDRVAACLRQAGPRSRWGHAPAASLAPLDLGLAQQRSA